jgi:antirestriction protein ArdC
MIRKTEEQEDSERSRAHEIPFMKAYTVFQCRSDRRACPSSYYVKPEPVIDPALRIDSCGVSFSQPRAQTFGMAAIRLTTRRQRSRANARLSSAFRSPEAYYATLAHELTHWTKHPKAGLIGNSGASAGAMKAMLEKSLLPSLAQRFCVPILASRPRRHMDHAAYIQSWLKVLKNDKRAIFSAAAYAQKAADYLHSLQPKTESTNQEKQGVAA